MNSQLNEQEKKAQGQFIEFIEESILNEASQPNNLVFITIRFAKQQKDINKAYKNTKGIFSRIFEVLGGRKWKSRIKGVVVIEKGRSGQFFHTHCILNLGSKTITDLDRVAHWVADKNSPLLNLTVDTLKACSGSENKNFNPKKSHMQIKPVDDLAGAISYVIKEINWRKNHQDFLNISTLQML
jgi:hypothetical protein